MPTDTPDTLRFLSQADAIEAGASDMSRCVDQMERVFELYDEDRVIMGGAGQYLHGHMTTFPSDLSDDEAETLRSGSRFGAMPAYVGGEIETIGVKWYGSVTPRADETAAPESPPLLVLSDPETGRPEVVMDGSIVSTMRTGAMAGLGARYLQGERARTASVIGPGRVGQASVLGLDAALPSLDAVRLYHPDIEYAKAVRSAVAERVSTTVTATDSMEHAVRGADVTVAAASRNPSPRIDPSWLTGDSTVIQLGDLRVPLDAFDDDRILCDIPRHPLEFETQVGWDFTRAFTEAIESDDGEIRLSDVRALHELVGGTDTAPTDGVSILSSLGLPMEDVAWGTEIYRTAVAQDLGQQLLQRSEPYFSTPS